MARIDKYDPISGGYRAPILLATVASTGAVGAGATAPFGVGHDSAGRVVVGAGTSGLKAILVLHSAKKVGDIVDCMTNGEVVEWGGAAGTNYTANTTTGVITTAAASATQITIGHTVEADRLVVRVKGA